MVSIYVIHMSVSVLIKSRANRAQYADVSFQSVADDVVTDVSLPSMQGAVEDEGT